ncbi:NTP/NDP exchange transporter [Rhabdochlamydiaceae symbiont of Dictyostelium giganteum]|uniref:NTP/NDP exchange transporter n=1 Tax=Rhabdochlamydiaceae symbiont of Dictyostelium giganteum TaxID=3342349 RepID=UPI00384EDB55
MGSRLLHVFQSICRFNFGYFEKEEFKKFLRMGLIFALIIGVYWTLRPLKDAIFIQLVDKLQLPLAKTLSVIALLPLVMFYTKLLEKNSREKMLMLLPFFYGIMVFLFGMLMFFFQEGQDIIRERSGGFLIATKAVGYLWYLFVESFGSLVVALFWAFSADTTNPASAKRGFPLVVAIGQLGGIIFPYSIGGLPHRLGLETDVLSMMCLGFLTLLIIPLVKYFLKATPSHLLSSFQESQAIKEVTPHEPGFLEGFKLMIKHKYLLGIFAANFIYEVIVTIFDFNFKVAAGEQFTGVALSHYLSLYGSSVNVVSLSCLLLGISNITRFLGVGIALALMPIIVGVALFGFLTVDTLSFLFSLMVGAKAINYALNGPALKQLYIPTSQDVKFKAQAWIETFGSRASKEAGSLFNLLLSFLQKTFGAVAGRAHYLTLSGILGFPLLLMWFMTAIYLGKTFRKAVEEKNIIC